MGDMDNVIVYPYLDDYSGRGGLLPEGEAHDTDHLCASLEGGRAPAGDDGAPRALQGEIGQPGAVLHRQPAHLPQDQGTQLKPEERLAKIN